jgi:formiminoglutamase
MQINLIDYLSPLKEDLLEFSDSSNLSHRLVSVDKFKGEISSEGLKAYDLAILSVPDDRESKNVGCSQSPDLIRKQLYRLFKPTSKVNIIDLGNLKTGINPGDVYFSLSNVIELLINHNITTIILGGSLNLTYGCYLAYQRLDKLINIVSVEPKLDITTNISQGNPPSFLSNIILNNSEHLFNYANLGYQALCTAPSDIELMNKFFFDSYRLGSMRSDLTQAEPVLRDADLVSIDISSIKQSDAPGHFDASPHGFYGEEACQLAKYSGLSDKVSCFGVYDVNPLYDLHYQTVKLAAQIIWYFIDGFYQRKQDYPISTLEKYTKFLVQFEGKNNDLVFYKSPMTDRWWLEVPFSEAHNKKPLIISCSYEDYKKACNKEIPERWWKFFQKIN